MGEVAANGGVRLRPAEASDVDALVEISMLTGKAGGDASALHRLPRIIGEIYSAPYLALHPDYALVAEDELGPAGYVVGAPDTRAFEVQLERDWWPALRARYADPSGISFEHWTADQVRAYQIHHPRPAAKDIVSRYPAHLHMNLHPRVQGRGVGPALLKAWLALAARQGVTGVHLGTNRDNARAIRFWSDQGFHRIERPSKPLSAVWFGRTLVEP